MSIIKFMKPLNPYAEKLKEFKFTFHYNQHHDVQILPLPPKDWSKWFKESKKSTKTILEIGCSNAHYLSNIALKNPDHFFVGIDWKYKVLFGGAKKIKLELLENIALLRANVQEMFSYWEPHQFDEVWVLFPDPWAKKSQRKNRLLREDFFRFLERSLKPNGRLIFKTDHPGYFRSTLALFDLHYDDNQFKFEMSVSDEKSKKSKQDSVRTIESGELPEKNSYIMSEFKIVRNSFSFWNEPYALDYLWKDEKTLFEKIFIKNNLPVYFLEIQKQG